MTLKLSAISALALTAALCGCKEEAAEPAEVRSVRTTVADERQVTEEQIVVGEIRPRHQSDIGFRVSGKVTERLVNVGDKVRNGDILARLDEEDYLKRLRAAEAEAMAAKAVHDEARTAFARQATLFDKGIVSRSALEAAQRSLRSAEASLSAAQISVGMARDQLAYATLVSDFSGIVTTVGAEVGQVVNPGQMIVRVAPSGDVDAVFAVAEASVQDNYFAEGAPVGIELLSDPGISAAGVVREISPIADAATRTFEVKVTLSDAPAEMLFGSGVTGTVKRNTERGVELPSGAIFDQGGVPAVWVFDRASGSVSLRPVDVAAFDAGQVIVDGGIGSGDIIVTAGVNQLREGQTVRLSEGE